MITDLETQKIQRIQELLNFRLNNTDLESVYFSFEDLKKEPLLKDRTGVEKILELIKQKTDGGVSWKIISKRFELEMRAASGPYPGFSEPQEVGIEINVSDPSQLNKYFDLIFIPTQKENTVFKIQPKTFIEQKQDGKFYCKDRLIEFPNPDSMYAKFFQIIFELSITRELIKYDQINKQLETRGVTKLTDHKKIMDRLKNARHRLFRHVQDLPRKTPMGEPLIKPQGGVGIIFNNPIQSEK